MYESILADNENIIDIHASIMEEFENNQETLAGIESRLRKLKCMRQSGTTCTAIDTEIEHLQQRYHTLQNNTDAHFYTLESTVLLDQYKAELAKPVCINFMGKPEPVDTTKRDALYKDFVKLASSTGEVPVRAHKRDNSCPTCNNRHVSEIRNEATNTMVCDVCGTERDDLYLAFSYTDSNRVNITTKYTYNRRAHFKECINQFQGKQHNTVSDDVLEKIRNKLCSYSLVDEAPNEYARVTLGHIEMIIKEIQLSRHYDDVNLIYHLITGKELPDISHLEEVLLDDFDKLSALYNEEYVKTKRVSRKSFINIQCVFFQLLAHHKYPCSKHDFNFLKTIDKKSFHDDVGSKLFSKLGWNFTHIF